MAQDLDLDPIESWLSRPREPDSFPSIAALRAAVAARVFADLLSLHPGMPPQDLARWVAWWASKHGPVSPKRVEYEWGDVADPCEMVFDAPQDRMALVRYAVANFGERQFDRDPIWEADCERGEPWNGPTDTTIGNSKVSTVRYLALLSLAAGHFPNTARASMSASDVIGLEEKTMRRRVEDYRRFALPGSIDEAIKPGKKGRPKKPTASRPKKP